MSHTFKEISNQSVSWNQTLEYMDSRWDQLKLAINSSPETHFVFIGSGTSFYLAQSASRLFQQLTGRITTAIPSSEIFIAPISSIPQGVPVVAFAISRSGTTSEVLLAVDFIRENYPHIKVIGVTCHSEHTLAQISHSSIALNHASEESVVMTQSFTNMLLSIQYTAAKLAQRKDKIEELHQLPGLLEQFLPQTKLFGQQWGESENLSQYIFLGLGPYYGLAAEATLKLKEMTQTSCEYYNPLEFRHGPISIVKNETAVIILSGKHEAEYIESLVENIQDFNGTTCTLAPNGTNISGSILTLPGDISDWSRSVLYMPALQYTAYYRAKKLGLNPDKPRNLNQVVII